MPQVSQKGARMNIWILRLVIYPIAIADALRMWFSRRKRVRCSGGMIEIEEKQWKWN